MKQGGHRQGSQGPRKPNTPRRHVKQIYPIRHAWRDSLAMMSHPSEATGAEFVETVCFDFALAVSFDFALFSKLQSCGVRYFDVDILMSISIGI